MSDDDLCLSIEADLLACGIEARHIPFATIIVNHMARGEL